MQRMMTSQLIALTTTALWVLINLDLFSTCSGQNTYYVSSATDSACPSTPCLNFSQYIQNSDTYFTSNTTFIFRPGDHIVEKNVVIANVNILKLTGRSETKPRIVCTLPAGFALDNVSNAEFASLEFISCGAQDYPFSTMFLNEVANVKLTNCSFQNSKSTALYALNSVVVLTWNSFRNNSANYGGAILSIHSHIYLQEKNTFAYNSANVGGAIAMTFFSTFNGTGKSVFISNTATQGGGIFVIKSTAMFAGDSHFVENTAVTGSMIYVREGLFLLSGNQTFIQNFAFFTGGILIRNAQMNMHGQSTFVNNTSQYGAGSSIWGRDCALNITGNVTFLNTSGISAGALAAVRCNLSFYGNNTFHNNYGYAFGAVLIANSSVVFEGNTCFTNNHAQVLSGALNMRSSNITFLGTVSFIGNTVIQPGSAAIFAVYGDILFDGKTTFINNSGTYGAAALFSGISVRFRGKSLFINNSAYLHGGAIYTVNSQVSFSRDFLFSGNHAGGLGGAIAAANSTMNCSANGTFLNNSAIEGGGLSFELNSRFVFSLTMVVYFSSNTAQRGGAIHVRDNVQSIECTNDPRLHFATSLATNPLQCFFEVVNNGTNSLDYKPLWFEDNTAIEEGSALYGGRLDKCELNQHFQNFENTSLSVFQDLSEFQTDNSNTTLISSAPFCVCFCVENKPNCTYQQPAFSVRRGETFSISIAALDQADQPIPAIIRSYILSSVGTLAHLRRGNSLQQTGRGCTELHYQVFSEDTSQELILYAEGPCHDVGEAQKSVDLTFRPCPVGFQLLHGECVCDRQLKTFTTECNIEDATVTRTNNFWMSPYYSENDTYIGLILHLHCPLDYCVTGPRNVSPSDPDSLCAHNRSGILCGACQQNFSLALGSSRCLKCENAYLSLIIPLALSGIALVIFLFVLKLTVAIGTINGLIFYANFIVMNQSAFLPSGDTNILTIFIAWLNLDLGIETCFYDGMDTYAWVWLQFVFPVYVWMLVGLIILASSMSMRVAKIFGNNPVSVLATLFLLSYAKILRTIIAVLSFTIIDYPDGSRVTVWLYDGNITYLASKHIPLCVTALLTLLLLFFPYTILLLLGQWLSPLSNVKGFSWLNNTKVKSFMDAYHAPYTAKCRYWTGLLLLVRLGSFLAFAFNVFGDSSVNLLVITSTSFGLAMWYILADKVYLNWYLNTLESSFILNLGILSLATLYIRGTGGSQVAATYLSVSIAFIAFFGILFYHIYRQLKDTKVGKKLGKLFCIQRKVHSNVQSNIELQVIDSGDNPLKAPSTTVVELRESLLDD